MITALHLLFRMTAFGTALGAFLAFSAVAAQNGPSGADSVRRRLEDVYSNKLLKTSGFCASVAATGAPVWERNADRLFSTASCMKLLTTAAALHRWGNNHYFKTVLLTDSVMSGAIVNGHLYVKGYGDPFLVTEILTNAAYHLRARGLRQITGDLILDDSYLKDTPNTETNDRAYSAKGGALSYNFNCVTVFVRPGRRAGDSAVVFVEPDLDGITVTNRVVTGDSGSGVSVDHQSSYATYAGDHMNVFVSGAIGLDEEEMSLSKRVDDPTLFTGLAIRQALELMGIAIKGKTVKGATPPTAVKCHEINSYKLSTIIDGVNKWSNNFVATQLVMIMGAEEFGEPGTDEKGVRVLRRFIDTLGLSQKDFVITDGSGLDAANQMTPRALVRLLEHMYGDFRIGPEFLSSMSIGGIDGSERKRFKKHGGPVGQSRLKIGYLWGISGLCGYIESRQHGVIAFAILTNDFPKDYYETVKQLEDRVCRILWEY